MFQNFWVFFTEISKFLAILAHFSNFFGKKHLIALNILNFANSKKAKLKNYLDTLKTIDKLGIPKFSFDGNYLKEKGVKEGVLIGIILKLIENEWLDNDFKISNERVLEIIKTKNI